MDQGPAVSSKNNRLNLKKKFLDAVLIVQLRAAGFVRLSRPRFNFTTSWMTLLRKNRKTAIVLYEKLIRSKLWLKIRKERER